MRTGLGGLCLRPIPFLGVPNVTAHPSMASISISVLLYDGLFLCGFNVAIRGLTATWWNPNYYYYYYFFFYFFFNPLDSKGNYGATSTNTKLIHWLLIGGLLHLVTLLLLLLNKKIMSGVSLRTNC